MKNISFPTGCCRTKFETGSRMAPPGPVGTGRPLQGAGGSLLLSAISPSRLCFWVDSAPSNMKQVNASPDRNLELYHFSRLYSELSRSLSKNVGTGIGGKSRTHACMCVCMWVSGGLGVDEMNVDVDMGGGGILHLWT